MVPGALRRVGHALPPILLLWLAACSREERGRPEPVAGGVFRFEEGAVSAGVVFEHRSGDVASKRYLIETTGSGLALADFDGDEHLDLYLLHGGRHAPPVQPEAVNRLFFGDGQGRFRPGPSGDAAEDPSFAFGASAADYDRDGDIDLYLCNYGPNKLLRNRGDGTFEDVTDLSGTGDPGWSTAAAWGDVDGDGWLDLYVGNYFEFGSPESLAKLKCVWAGIPVICGPEGMTPEPDRLYRNRGDGTFEDVSQSSGILAVEPRYTLAVMMTDIDEDGDLDIYVANDSVANSLFENDGRGHFVDQGLLGGTALSSEGVGQAGMGIATEDFDGDGRYDIIVTNFARDYNTFYHARRDGTFDDQTTTSGLAASTYQFLAFGIVAEDFDADGWLDLFFANGHVYPNVDQHSLGTSYAQRNQVFRNLGGGRFEDQEGGRAGPGLVRLAVSRGAVGGDLDEDGRVDIALSNLDGPAEILWNRGSPRGRWLAVRVRAAPGVSDRTCVGTQVKVQAGGRSWKREVRAGTSYASCSLADLYFGLGSVAAVDQVEVVFPGGQTLRFHDVGLDRILLVEHPR